EGQPAHRRDTLGIGAGQPVDHVDVVRALLQQQTGAPGTFGMPVLEVVVPAIPHEMTAPDRLHPADLPAVDDLLHGAYHGHVAHVVAHVQRTARFGCCGQHRIGRTGGD